MYPLLALLYPDHLKWICQGWLKAYEEGGWIPKWASPGYRNSMVGTYGDVVLAEAVVKGVLTGQDADKAWNALRRDAYEEAPPGGAVGKVGLRVYEQHGYIPDDSGVSDCVSRTLDFAHADWATAQAARLLNHPEDAEKLTRRAQEAMRQSFDSQTGLMRPKSRTGRFSMRFDETRWGDGYTEGPIAASHVGAFTPCVVSGRAGGLFFDFEGPRCSAQARLGTTRFRPSTWNCCRDSMARRKN